MRRTTAIGGPIVYGTLLRQLAYRSVLDRLGLPGRILSKILGVVFNARIVIENRVTPHQLSEDNAIVCLVEVAVAS